MEELIQQVAGVAAPSQQPSAYLMEALADLGFDPLEQHDPLRPTPLKRVADEATVYLQLRYGTRASCLAAVAHYGSVELQHFSTVAQCTQGF